MLSKYNPPVGVLIRLSDEVSTITAPNSSPMTFKGTQTYLIGKGKEVAIIDPGPVSEGHLQAIKESISGKKLSGIFITHSHLDHSPLGKIISQEYESPIYAFGKSGDGRSEIMKKYALMEDIGGGEGVDYEFEPDVFLTSKNFIDGADWTLEAIHTPGHMQNHLCFSLNNGQAIFTGDLVMGWSTTLISPPDGDMGQYKKSLQNLLSRSENIYYPGHGAPIKGAKDTVRVQLNHRIEREKQIIFEITGNGKSIPDIVETIYPTLSQGLKIAACRNVFAHLLHLSEMDMVKTLNGVISQSSIFKLK